MPAQVYAAVAQVGPFETHLRAGTGRAEVEHFSHLASYDEIAGNDYNLSVSTYVEAQDTREKIDIVKLNAELKEIVEKENKLRAEIDKIIAELQ